SKRGARGNLIALQQAEIAVVGYADLLRSTGNATAHFSTAPEARVLASSALPRNDVHRRPTNDTPRAAARITGVARAVTDDEVTHAHRRNPRTARGPAR